MEMPNLDIYLLNDQPTTCFHCGTRTEWTEQQDCQLHTCPACQLQFITMED